MEPIEFTGTIDRRVYSRALQVYGGQVAVLSLLYVAVGIYGFSSSRLDEPATWAMPGSFLLIGIVLLAILVRGALRDLYSHRMLQSSMSGNATSVGLTVRSPSGDENIRWDQFDRATIQRDLLLLFSSDQCSYIVSSKFFASEAAWQDFRQIVRERVRGPSPVKSSLITALTWLAIIMAMLFAWSVRTSLETIFGRGAG